MKNFILALTSGLLLALCFPSPGLTWLAWVWPWPMFAILWGRRETTLKKKAAFGLGYVTGLTFFLTTLYWIIPVHWAGWIALSFYLALYPAVWALLIRWLAPQPNIKNVFAAAFWWTGLEWIRGTLMTGFSWNQLGILLPPGSWLTQPAEWIGAAGLGFGIMLISGLCWLAISGKTWRPLIPAAATLVLWLACGWFLKQSAQQIPTVNREVLLLQPNVALEDKWKDMQGEQIWANLSPQEQEEITASIHRRYDQLFDLTKKGLEKGPVDLVAWPESSLHYPFHDPFNQSFLDEIAKLGDFTLALGADVFDPKSFNCLVALKGGYMSHEIYRKVHRVVFGEYMPLRYELPWLANMIGDLLPYDFDAGDSTEPITMKGSPIEIVPLVCFEDTVADLVPKFARSGPQVLVNISNDAWFEKTGEQEQHYWTARMRAIETRRPLVRACNVGVTSAISAIGDELGKLEKYTSGVLRVSVPVADNPPLTLFSRIKPMWANLGWTAALLAHGLWQWRGGRRKA